MDERARQLLQGLDPPRQLGLEIGPMDRPIVPRSLGKVIYVDRWSPEELRRCGVKAAWYDIQHLQIDAVWRDNRLSQAIGSDLRVDYVIASHVIEHTPDLIDWLAQIREVLAPGGSLRLAVPDRRYTFDVLRDPSRPADIMAAHIDGRTSPSAFCSVDCLISQSDWGGIEAWERQGELSASPIRTPKEAFDLAQENTRSTDDVDVHCWVFTPYSFSSVMEILARAGLVLYACDFVVGPSQHSNEFMCALSPVDCPEQAAESWAVVRNREADTELARQARVVLARLKARSRRTESSSDGLGSPSLSV